MTSFGLRLSGQTCLLLGLAAGSAWAQGQEGSPGAGGNPLAGAVVVTATRTPEPMETVPASVTTFDREEILAEAALLEQPSR